jgi:FtsH-binding integral membrane protein
LLPIAAVAASSSLLHSKTTTTLLFSSFQGISILGILPMGCCFFFFTATFKDNNKNIFSSLLFSSFQGISIMGILPIVPIHKIKYTQRIQTKKNL